MNLDEILATIQDGDPKETFLSKLAATNVETPEPTPVEKEKIAEAEDEELMKKVAEEVDAQGRIMARAFMDELNKIAVSTQMVDTPHPAAIVENPAVEMGKDMPGMIPGQDITGRVSAIINQLKAPTEAGVSEIVQTGNVVDVPPRSPIDEAPPIAYDANNAAQKTAGDRILEQLWKLHVTRGEK